MAYIYRLLLITFLTKLPIIDYCLQLRSVLKSLFPYFHTIRISLFGIIKNNNPNFFEFHQNFYSLCSIATSSAFSHFLPSNTSTLKPYIIISNFFYNPKSNLSLTFFFILILTYTLSQNLFLLSQVRK